MNANEKRVKKKGARLMDRLTTPLDVCKDLLHKLEAERDNAVADLKEALTANSDETLCKYCKNYFECEGEKCPEFISGVGDAEGKYPTWKWSCMDFDYCAMLENTPCHACHDNAYDGFEWRGTAKEEKSK